MGKEKKHKKHKSDRREKYEELPVSRPPMAGSGPSSGPGLKLVLKVGVTPEHETHPATPPPAVAPLRLSMAAITEAETQRREKKHKKKKKKDKERDREHKERHRLKKERRHLEAAWSASVEDSSRLSSSTEPLSQGTTSSPEPPHRPEPEPEPEPECSPEPSPVQTHGHGSDMGGHGHDRRVRHEHDAGPEHEHEHAARHERGYEHITKHVPGYQHNTRHQHGYEHATKHGHGNNHGTGHEHEYEHATRHGHVYEQSTGHEHGYEYASRDGHEDDMRHEDGYEHSAAHGHAAGHVYDPGHGYERDHGHQCDCNLAYSAHVKSPGDPYAADGVSHPPCDHYPCVPDGSAASCTPSAYDRPGRPPRTSLQRLLEFLLRGLEKKDVQRFFRAPVTDLLAPGYSHVISNPMDFSTMLSKIHANLYSTVPEFNSDFRLMCTNAMAYNRSDTVYYKAAKRLLHIGTKMMTPEKLRGLRSMMPIMLELGPAVLGFEVLPPPPPDPAAPVGSDTPSEQLREPDPVDEEAEAEEILQQVQEAARRAAERVAKSKHAPKLGFLRRQADGSTTMAVLTPSADGEEEPDKPIAVGVMAGRFSQGCRQLAGVREDRRQQPRPAKPVFYGIFGSFGSWYETAFGGASKNKEESELLAQTYGKETPQQYARSVRQFAEGCPLATQTMDNLLDIMTDGRHRRAWPRLDQLRVLAREERAVNTAMAAAVPPPACAAPPPPPPPPPADLASLRSLSKLGIDVGFVDSLEAEERLQREAGVHQRHTSDLLVALSELQRRRLSQAAEAGPRAPSVKETELAEALASRLTPAEGPTPPGDAVAAPAPAPARRTPAAGPPPSASPDNPSSHEEVDVEAVSTAATPEVRPVDTPPAATATPDLREMLVDV